MHPSNAFSTTTATLLWITVAIVAQIGYITASHGHHRWLRTEVMDGNGLYVLDWKIVGKDIVFRITANTRGFIGLGFSKKTGKMADADLILAWVDDRTGKPNVLVRKQNSMYFLSYIYLFNCVAYVYIVICKLQASYNIKTRFQNKHKGMHIRLENTLFWNSNIFFFNFQKPI